MATNSDQGGLGENRVKRIRFLRRLILLTIAAACLIPTSICLLLAVKYHRVNNTLDKAKEELAWYEEHFGEAALAGDSESGDPLAPGTMDKEEKKDGEEQTLEESSDAASSETVETESPGALVSSDSLIGDSNDFGLVAGNPDEKSNLILENSEADNNEWDGVRRVYLTFDDGPSIYTNEILDILDSYGVKASFFVIGKEGDASAKVYKRIVDDGHTLGMHSYSHRYSELYGSLESFATDMHKLQTYLYETTGVWSTYYRFPGGSSNTVSRVNMRDLIDYLGLENITYYDWNVASSDDREGVTKDIIVSNVMTGIPKFHNAFVLLHDATDKRTTIEALPEIIEQIQQMENTVIVPITEETLPVQHISNSQ